MSLAAFLALVSSPAVPLVLGAFGSLVEVIGRVANSPRIEAAGKALEAVGADIPKIVANTKALLSGKASK